MPVVVLDVLVKIDQHHARRLLALVAKDSLERDVAVRVDLFVARVVLACELAEFVLTDLADPGQVRRLRASTRNNGDIVWPKTGFGYLLDTLLEDCWQLLFAVVLVDTNAEAR